MPPKEQHLLPSSPIANVPTGMAFAIDNKLSNPFNFLLDIGTLKLELMLTTIIQVSVQNHLQRQL